MLESSSGVTDVRHEIATIAGPREWGDTRESWLNKVCRKVPTVPFRTVKALFYGEIHNQDHWAARELKRAAALIAARQEATALAAQFNSIAGGLLEKDAEFFSEDIAALRSLARKLGAADRAGGE